MPVADQIINVAEMLHVIRGEVEAMDFEVSIIIFLSKIDFSYIEGSSWRYHKKEGI